MKQLNKMSRINAMFEKAYDLLNRDFFNNELSSVVITLTPDKSAYGYYTTVENIKINGTPKRQINIGTDTMGRPIENVIATLLHEMTHHYNATVLKIQDCSRSGLYHNKKFKESAEKDGLLHIKYAPSVGWSYTEPTEKLIEWILNQDRLTDVYFSYLYDIGKTGKPTGTPKGKTTGKSPTTHSIKYQCPLCGISCRATKPIYIICGDCGVEMERQ